MRRFRDQRALQFESNWHLWGEFQDFAGSVDRCLSQAGVGRGEPVALILRNRPTGVAALLGLLAAGRSALLISPIQPTRSLCDDIRSLQPAVVIADDEDWSARLESAASSVGAGGLVLSSRARVLDVAVHPTLVFGAGRSHYRLPEGAAIMVPTSGTTGPPKRIPLSWDRIAGYVRSPDFTDGRRVVIDALSLVTITGLTPLLVAATRPTAISLMERLDVLKWAELVQEHRPRVAGLPPAAMRMILDERVPKEMLESLDGWITGSAPLPVELADEFEDTYEIPILSAYGATEFTGSVTAWNLEDRARWGRSKRGSVGRPVPGVSVRVVDPDDGSVLPAGESGILEIRSPGSAIGDSEDWVCTADLAHIDEDGFLYVEGRVDDVIIRGGFKVSLSELDRVMATHPAVKEAASVGLADDRLGKVPATAVVPIQGAERAPSEAALKAWVRDRLAPYKVPVRVRVVSALPLNPSLKISRPALRKLLDRD